MHSMTINCTLLCTGSQFWRTTKVIRALTESDYSRLIGKRSDQPGPSKLVTVSDSDSDEVKPLIRHKKRRYDSSDSDSSLPDVKLSSVGDSSTMKLLSEIKVTLETYHREMVNMRLEKEVESSRSSIFMIFSCIICKDIVSAEASPVVPPCCQAAIICRACLERWLQSQQSCPHCREEISNIEICTPLPVLRPLYNLLSTSNQE